jgi:phosphatidate phosphatase APP1
VVLVDTCTVTWLTRGVHVRNDVVAHAQSRQVRDDMANMYEIMWQHSFGDIFRLTHHELH